MPGLRNVTKDSAVVYFTVDEDLREIRILALVFGGQDYQRHMLKRMSL
jgi:plasmid stabilization system protein ParE